MVKFLRVLGIAAAIFFTVNSAVLPEDALDRFAHDGFFVEREIRSKLPNVVLTRQGNGLRGPVKEVIVETHKVANGKPLTEKLVRIYDRKGRFIKIISRCDDYYCAVNYYFLRGRLAYSYKTHGEIRKWNSTERIDYIRDKQGRIIETRQRSDDDTYGLTLDQWRWDECGRLIEHEPTHREAMNEASYVYNYDAAGRVTKREYWYVDSAGGVGGTLPSVSYETLYSYIENTRELTITSPWGDSGRARETYDKTRVVKKEVLLSDSHEWKERATFEYDNAGHATGWKITDDNGEVVATFKYDKFGNLLEERIKSTVPGCDSSLKSYTYKCDSHGNWTKRISNENETITRRISYYK